MKRFALLVFLVALAAPMAAQIQTTTVTGTVTGYFNQPLPGHPYTIKEMRRGRLIIPMTDFTDYTDSLGALSFNVPRSNFATFDTTKIRIYINAPVYNVNGDRGVWLIVPDAPTAELSTLPHTVYLGPPGYAVLIPPQGDRYGDSLYVADSLARVARAEAALALTEADTAQMAADAAAIVANAARDSARFANQRLDVAEANIIDVEARRDTTGKYERDRMDDLQQDISGKQSQLSVAQLARIDSLLGAGNGVTITSQGLIRVLSITESDPTATAKANAAIEDTLDDFSDSGDRAISSSKRIFSTMKSFTLTVAPSETVDLRTGNNFRCTLTRNDTLGFTNGIEGQVFQVVIKNGGTYTLAWSGVSWPGGTAPTLTAVLNKVCIFSFIVSDGVIYGIPVLNY